MTQASSSTPDGTTDPQERVVEDGGGILCVRNPDTHRGWNGIRYKTGMSAKNVGSRALSMNVATVPPGAVASHTSTSTSRSCSSS